jgi:Fe-S-cluster-containing dehydrogenase component
MHCNDPACVSACIVGALTKSEDGPVVYDETKCIGCRYCLVACPFQMPAYEYDRAIEPRVRKCDLCESRIRDGQVPACVAACPVQALTFGKRGDLIEQGRSTIAQNPSHYTEHIYGETEVGGTSWMYLSAVSLPRSVFPKLPVEPIPEYTETIQHAIFKSFLPPLGLYVLLALVMHATGNKQLGETDE